MHKEYATVFEEYRPDLIFLADLFDDQAALQAKQTEEYSLWGL